MGPLFFWIQILVSYELLVWNLFFKKQMKITHEDDFQNQASWRFC